MSPFFYNKLKYREKVKDWRGGGKKEYHSKQNFWVEPINESFTIDIEQATYMLSICYHIDTRKIAGFFHGLYKKVVLSTARKKTKYNFANMHEYSVIMSKLD